MGCAILAASLSSCVNDWLDVAPSDGTDADAALTSSSDLDAARTGMYKALKGNSSLVDYYGMSSSFMVMFMQVMIISIIILVVLTVQVSTMI